MSTSKNGVKLIEKYFPSLTSTQISQFEQVGDLYKEWNAQINLISRKDIEELYERHVLHALGIAKVQAFLPGASILDVGTGGGFPGIPLAIMFPESEFLLIDAIGKKVKVVNEVAQSLGLTNVKGEHIRAEQVEGKFDFIVSRAVTRMKPFYGWVRGKAKKESKHEFKNGILFLKGGDLVEEIKEGSKPARVYPLNAYFEEDFFETKKVVFTPLV